MSTNLFNKNHQLLYQTDKSSHWKCSVKKAVLNNFVIFTGNACVGVFLSTLLKTLTQAFYCCEIFKNTYFEEHLRTAASKLTLKSDYLELCLWTVALKDVLTC